MHFIRGSILLILTIIFGYNGFDAAISDTHVVSAQTKHPMILPSPNNSTFALSLPLISRDTVIATRPRWLVLTTGANNISVDPEASYDGSVVAFTSLADNLVANDTNGVADIFVTNIIESNTRVLHNITLASNGESASAQLSDDGRYVVFASLATTLSSVDTNTFWDIYRYDRESNTIELVSVALGGGAVRVTSRTFLGMVATSVLLQKLVT